MLARARETRAGASTRCAAKRCHSDRLWYGEPDYAVSYAKFFSRSHDAVIRVYDAVGNVIEPRSAA